MLSDFYLGMVLGLIMGMVLSIFVGVFRSWDMHGKQTTYADYFFQFIDGVGDGSPTHEPVKSRDSKAHTFKK